jgi:hypothetical protein
MPIVHAAIVIAGLALAACFRPSFDEPRCGPGGACPAGMTCGGDGVCRAPGTADAATGDAPPSDGPRCRVPARLGTAVWRSQNAVAQYGPEPTPQLYVLIGQLDDEPIPDFFVLELYLGFGVFTDGFVTGELPIAGVELNYATCGVCPWIAGDLDPATNQIAQHFYATGGSVTLDAIDPRMVGRFAVDLVEVTIDPNTFESTPVPGGCTTSLDGMFDVEVQHQGVAPAGQRGFGRPRPIR